MNSYQKYLKYKKKYFLLKQQQFGGGSFTVVNEDLLTNCKLFEETPDKNIYYVDHGDIQYIYTKLKSRKLIDVINKNELELFDKWSTNPYIISPRFLINDERVSESKFPKKICGYLTNFINTTSIIDIEIRTNIEFLDILLYIINGFIYFSEYNLIPYIKNPKNIMIDDDNIIYIRLDLENFEQNKTTTFTEFCNLLNNIFNEYLNNKSLIYQNMDLVDVQNHKLKFENCTNYRDLVQFVIKIESIYKNVNEYAQMENEDFEDFGEEY